MDERYEFPALPESWASALVDEVIEKISTTDMKLRQSEYAETGKLPVVDQGQSFIGGYTDKQELKLKTELPVIIFGDHTRIIKFVNFPFVVGADGVKVIRPKEVFDPKLFFHFLHAVKLPDKGYARHFQFLGKSLIAIPPHPEQHRIVAKIEELFSDLDAGVESLRKIQAQLKRYRQAVLKAAVEGKLTAEWRKANAGKVEPAVVLLERIRAERQQKWKWGKYKEPRNVDSSDLPSLPDGWLWVRAEQICDFITKGTTPAATNMKQGSGEIPFIKIYNLTKTGLLDFRNNPTFVSKATHTGQLARSKVYPGDVLMNLVGPPLGKVSIVPDTYPQWNLNQAIAIFRLMSGYEKKLLAYALLTDQILSWALKRSKATAGQHNLTLEISRDLPLPLPPLAEQQQIVAEVERRLSVADAVEKTVNISLKQAERLRQSILKRAFEGKLVPQDANDEPADKLLVRIKAEREQRETKTQEASANKIKKPIKCLKNKRGKAK